MTWLELEKMMNDAKCSIPPSPIRIGVYPSLSPSLSHTPAPKPKPKYKTYSVPGIVNTIFNGDTTIIVWEDGEKTIVHRAPNVPHDPYNAFCAAVCKRLFGSTDKVMKLMEDTDKALQACYRSHENTRKKEANRKKNEELQKEAQARRKQWKDETFDRAVQQILVRMRAEEKAKELLAKEKEAEGEKHDVPSDT